eukprot:TRINITY_DN11532_c0_g3_i3.p3 TRINITY_DN11532_c0_g3~~TRINITY_DN11532_c0_g3_i3.p3  ORF type:complete len:104 (+),score=27.15 TRINITY_DN11532_c0_g3_i3:287-598(+)
MALNSSVMTILTLSGSTPSVESRSDGTQPHLVNIQFMKKTRIQEVSMYLDFKTDESYTPSKISIRSGNSFYELQEIKVVDFEEPIGWFNFSLNQQDAEGNIIK